MSKIVGVTIDTKSTKSKNKIYYYKTEKDLKYGETIDIKVKGGGTPVATVVVEDSKKKFDYPLKDLDIV